MNNAADTGSLLLPKIWLQSAVLGSLWAASEIILGSFFHALHIPLRSLILASIGVSLMVAVGRNWPVKGLYWRAGLICALMKSLSPAGLILSPMVAIAAQGFLMELATRSLGRNFAGFVLGGFLALVWNLVQYVGYHILIYGMDIVGIYKKLYKLTSEVFPLPENDFWLPVWVSLSFHVVFGLTAAVIGFFLARPGQIQRIRVNSMRTRDVRQFQKSSARRPGHSLVLLFFNIAFFTGFFVVMYFVRFPENLLFTLPLLGFWMIRYRYTLRPLKKPLFWISFIVITLLSGLVIGQAQGPDGRFTLDGLWAGLVMNIRAFTLITGLSVIGYELSNPRIRTGLRSIKLQHIFLAMEAASKALPMIIANLPEKKLFFKKPGAVFSFLIGRTSDWLTDLEVTQKPHPNVVIITGEVHQGKTTLLLNLIEVLREGGWKTGGIVSRAVFEDHQRVGYDISDAGGGRTLPLSRKQGKNELRIGDYFVKEEGLEFGYQLLSAASGHPPDVLVVDEVGPWELTGNGWAPELSKLLMNDRLIMIWVVRKRILQQAIEKWNLTGGVVLEAGTEGAGYAADQIGELRKRIKQ